MEAMRTAKSDQVKYEDFKRPCGAIHAMPHPEPRGRWHDGPVPGGGQDQWNERTSEEREVSSCSPTRWEAGELDVASQAGDRRGFVRILDLLGKVVLSGNPTQLGPHSLTWKDFLRAYLVRIMGRWGQGGEVHF